MFFKKLFFAQALPALQEGLVANALSPKITLNLEIKVERI